MQVQPTITYRRIKRTDALDADIRARLAKLERFCPSVISARVSIGLVARHQLHGHRYHINIDLAVAGGEIAVSHEAGPGQASRQAGPRRTRRTNEPVPLHKDLKVALRDAFDTARRRLQDFVRRQRGV